MVLYRKDCSSTRDSSNRTRTDSLYSGLAAGDDSSPWIVWRLGSCSNLPISGMATQASQLWPRQRQ